MALTVGRITGSSATAGIVCAASCQADDDCPADKPKGVWKAKPKCGLTREGDAGSSPNLCMLECNLGLGCGAGQHCYSIAKPDGATDYACAYPATEETITV